LKRLGDLGIPALLLVGDQDSLVSASELAPLATGKVELQVLPGQRHHPLQGVGAKGIYDGIRSFLNTALGS
jgi:pimeloyl-ACP methyl ester carboxylesterase